jgi:hypothetical protein
MTESGAAAAAGAAAAPLLPLAPPGLGDPGSANA